MKKYIGFTMIEFMIVLVIFCVLAALAISSYTDYVKRGRRMDGINTLLQMSLAEERYRSTNTTYGTLAQVWSGVTTSAEGYYTLAITSNTATAYTLTATATGNQATDSADGTSCTTLTLSMSNGTITKSPTNCWPK